MLYLKTFIRQFFNFLGYTFIKSDGLFTSQMEMSIVATSSKFIISNLFKRESKLIIFDIGAHFGQSSQLYSELFKNAKVYSFEPFLKNYEVLKNQNIKNVETFNFGFSNKKSQEKFFINLSTATCSFLPLKDEAAKIWNMEGLKNVGSEICNFDTLDNFCSEMNINIIDFMKIDVQGSEYLVLEGAKELLSKRAIKNIQIEIILKECYEGQKTIGYYINLLEQYGYKLTMFSDFALRNGVLFQTDLFFKI